MECRYEHANQTSVDIQALPRTPAASTAAGCRGVTVEGVVVVDVVVQRCAGIDVSKRDAKVCVRSSRQRVEEDVDAGVDVENQDLAPDRQVARPAAGGSGGAGGHGVDQRLLATVLLSALGRAVGDLGEGVGCRGSARPQE